MEAGIALVAGIIIGGLIEWVVDWQYWRRGIAGFYATEANLRTELTAKEEELQSANNALEQSKNELSATRAQLHAERAKDIELQQRLDASSAGVSELATKLSHNAKDRVVAAKSPENHDQLGRIEGIDSVYEQRLISAGVVTYAQLAMITPDDLNSIIQPAAWQRVDFDYWIVQANELMASESAGSADPEEI